ncbi:hypothetical protein B0T13DRAFT_444116 [Neurospora crassa]|nr:hypothetical protein B0T13DRAFT_444116 [Neurospora crassa]
MTYIGGWTPAWCLSLLFGTDTSTENCGAALGFTSVTAKFSSSKRKCRIDPPMSDLPSRRAGPGSLGNMNLEPRLAPILKRPWKRTRTSRRTTGREGRPGPAKSRHVTHPGTLP